MRTDVVGLHLEITDAIREHAEAKVDKLTRYYDGILAITVRLQQVDHIHRPEFQTEQTVDVEKHDDFVASATGDDLYLTIDAAVQKAARQLTDFKEKLKLGGHHPRS